MLDLDSMFGKMPFRPTTAALNHLLAQNSWVLPRLVRYAGKTVRFDIAPLSFCYTIAENGMLISADTLADIKTNPDARCVSSPALLPRLALRDEAAYNQIRSEGDAGLLAEIFYLARNLRWDVAEDLSGITGDILAEHIVKTVQSTHHQIKDAALNLSQAAAEYWTEERPLLARPQHVAAFMHQADVLRDDVERLEQRINYLLAGKKI